MIDSWQVNSRLRRWLLGGLAAVVMVAVGVAINEVYQDDRGELRGVWLAAALVSAILSVSIGIALARTPPRAALAVTDRRGRPPLIANATTAQLGVHPSSFDSSDVGPYLERDIDASIRAALLARKPLTIVHGPRLAGTTRSLVQQLQRTLPGLRVLVFRPDPTIALTDMLEVAGPWARRDGAVLWLDAITSNQLDELDAVLLRSLPDGLRICVTADTATLTGAHVPARVVDAVDAYATTTAVGTITAPERRALLEAGHYADVRPALDSPEPILLGRLLISLDQLAAALSQDDEEATKRTALVRVVTDWARLGMPERLDRKLLRALYEKYWRQLTGSASTAAVSKSGFERALAWATSSTTDRIHLIDKVIGGHHRPHPLLTVIASDPGTEWAVADPLWNYAAQNLTPSERIRLALRAFDRDDYLHTRRLLATIDLTAQTHDALSALVPVLTEIGERLEDLGEADRARRWWKRVIATDHPNAAPQSMIRLARLEANQGDVAQARRWYTAATAADHPESAMFELARLEKGQSDVAQARYWYRAAAAADHSDTAPLAMLELGELEEEQGDVVQARKLYRAAAASGHRIAVPLGLTRLGELAEGRGSVAQARRCYKSAAAAGQTVFHFLALIKLGELEEIQGDVDQARHWYGTAAATEQPLIVSLATGKLGELEKNQGDVDQARYWYKATIVAGQLPSSVVAMLNLGGLEEAEGDFRQARHWYEAVIASDETESRLAAMMRIAAIDANNGAVEEARRWYEAVVAINHPLVVPSAMAELGILEAGRGNFAKARQWYAAAIARKDSNGTPVAMYNLAELEEEQGDMAQARYWYEATAATGDGNAAPLAAEHLGRLYLEQGDRGRARRWLALAVDTDHPVASGRAALTLGNVDFEDHQHEQARAWFERATGVELAGIASEAAAGLTRVCHSCSDGPVR